MTEPREPASDETEPIATPDGSDDAAARAEADAAAMAADELGGEDEPSLGVEPETEAPDAEAAAPTDGTVAIPISALAVEGTSAIPAAPRCTISSARQSPESAKPALPSRPQSQAATFHSIMKVLPALSTRLQ